MTRPVRHASRTCSVVKTNINPWQAARTTAIGGDDRRRPTTSLCRLRHRRRATPGSQLILPPFLFLSRVLSRWFCWRKKRRRRALIIRVLRGRLHVHNGQRTSAAATSWHSPPTCGAVARGSPLAGKIRPVISGAGARAMCVAAECVESIAPSQPAMRSSECRPSDGVRV